MRTRIQRWALLGVLSAVMGWALIAPAQAAGTTQISGSGYYDDAAGTECGMVPAGFADFTLLVLPAPCEGVGQGTPCTGWSSDGTPPGSAAAIPGGAG